MPKVLPCPRCGYSRSWSVRRYHRKCKQCRAEWSPGTHHPVPSLRLTKKEWLRVGDSFLRDGTIQSVAQETRLAYGTAQRAVLAIRRVMAGDTPSTLMGICEADETYVGGSWKNKAIHIRARGSKRGRGTAKQAIVGILQRDPQRVRVWLAPNAQARTLLPLIRSAVCLGSTVYSDGHKPYRRLPRYGYFHAWVDHEAGEYVRGRVHTQTIDGYWGLLKTHLDAIGGIRKERLPLFIGEHVWRYNFRRLTRREQAQRICLLLTRFGGRK